MFTDSQISCQDLITWHEAMMNARSEMVNRINEYFGRKRGRNGKMEWGANSNPKHSAN